MPPGRSRLYGQSGSRSSSMPFGLGRASNTIRRVKNLQEVSESPLRSYRDAVVHPEFCCDEIVAGRGVFDVNRASLAVAVNPSLSM